MIMIDRLINTNATIGDAHTHICTLIESNSFLMPYKACIMTSSILTVCAYFAQFGIKSLRFNL